jgi:hypothetical protein
VVQRLTEGPASVSELAEPFAMALTTAEAWIARQRALWENCLDRPEDYLRERQARETQHDEPT